MSTAKKLDAFVARSLHSRLMVSYSLCSIAESEVRDAQITRATHTLKAIRELRGEIELLRAPPDGLSITERREAEDLIGEVEERVRRIETAISKTLL
ncbi:MAG TPA: hypothetical protein VHX37_08380 [Acidobacteriaceae bacterium]|jgi:hypothetical protein|nr:hypothetical protein [Acidobacteriaceae bacterium]